MTTIEPWIETSVEASTGTSAGAAAGPSPDGSAATSSGPATEATGAEPVGAEPQPVRRAQKRWSRWPARAAVAAVALVCAGVAVASLSGTWKVLRVPTGSMEPTIARGSAILVESVSTDEVRVGDVIVFRAPETDELTVHRVVELEQDGDGIVVRTRGDANDADDPWQAHIEAGRIHRYRADLPLVGSVTSSLADRTVRVTVAGFSALLVLGAGLMHIWRPTRRRQDPGADISDSSADSSADSRADSRTRPEGRTRHLGHRRSGSHRRRSRSTASSVLVVALAVGAATTVAADRADAAFTGATGTLEPVSSGKLIAPSTPSCRWASGTQIAVGWSMGPGGVQTGAEVIRTTLAGGSPTTVATVSPPTVGTALVTAPTPVTTPYRYSIQTTRPPWTSAPTTSMRSDQCARAVTAFAGTGTAGFSGDGGAATAATLQTPRGTAAAADGSVYVADTGNNRIRRIAPDGTISTFAGGPVASPCSYSGPVNGLGLNGPRGVATDVVGNVIVADSGSACIRRIDTSGNVTRVAGGGANTSCNATMAATAVSLSSPGDVAVEPSGAVIVADTGRNCIRRVSGGIVTHVAGGGGTTTCNTSVAASAVLLGSPAGVAVDPSGAVIVADTGRNCIRRVSGGTVTHVAGGGATTSCSSASIAAGSVSLSGPESVAVDVFGRVVVADTGRRCLRLVTAATVTPVGFSGAAGSAGDGGPVQTATLRSPTGLTLTSTGELLVADRATASGSNRVRRIFAALS